MKLQDSGLAPYPAVLVSDVLHYCMHFKSLLGLAFTIFVDQQPFMKVLSTKN